MKSKLLMFALLLASAVLISAGVLINKNPGYRYSSERASLLIREIGHRLLLHAGDSSSRILSVKELGENSFVLRFESAFAFMPDTLVKITERKLSAEKLASKYRVNVIDCVTKDVVYGFEMREKDNDIVPCLGRIQPTGCYYIRITFTDVVTSGNQSIYYMTFFSVAGLVLVLGYSLRRRDTEKRVPVNSPTPIVIGKFHFMKDDRSLTNGVQRIELSDKETKLLTVLSGKINQLIDREELIKEIWVKDGVITGRSLDMFISKLRKKLILDPGVRIINVHGRGYKLEIIND